MLLIAKSESTPDGLAIQCADYQCVKEKTDYVAIYPKVWITNQTVSCEKLDDKARQPVTGGQALFTDSTEDTGESVLQSKKDRYTTHRPNQPADFGIAKNNGAQRLR